MVHPTKLEACNPGEYSPSYDVHQLALCHSSPPEHMVLHLGDHSLATRYVGKIHNEETSPHGSMSEASVSTLHRNVQDHCLSQSRLSIPIFPIPVLNPEGGNSLLRNPAVAFAPTIEILQGLYAEQGGAGEQQLA